MSKEINWLDIKTEYIAGGTSYRRLAEKYNVSFAVLRRVAERERWTELRTQVKQESDTKLVKSVAQDNVNHSLNINEVADKLLQKIEDMISQDGLTPQSIKHLTSAIKDIKEIKGIKSYIDLQEQEARIDKLRREINESKAAEDKPHGVILMPNIMGDLKPPEESNNG